MKKTLLALALLGMSASAFAVPPGPTCGSDEPFDLQSTINATDVDLSWDFDVGNTCDPTKYAIEVFAQYGPFPLVDSALQPLVVPIPDCDGTTLTLSFASEKGDPAPMEASFLRAALAPPPGYCFCAPTEWKVKALTTHPHGPNKSQNNAWSDVAEINLTGCTLEIF